MTSLLVKRVLVRLLIDCTCRYEEEAVGRKCIERQRQQAQSHPDARGKSHLDARGKSHLDARGKCHFD